MELEVHIIIAVQFTEVRVVAEVRIVAEGNDGGSGGSGSGGSGGGGEDSWLQIAQTTTSINNATLSLRHWEYMVFFMEMTDPGQLHQLPLGDAEIRLRMVLHGRLGDVAVDTVTRTVLIRSLNDHLSDLYDERGEGLEEGLEGPAETPENLYEQEEAEALLFAQEQELRADSSEAGDVGGGNGGAGDSHDDNHNDNHGTEDGGYDADDDNEHIEVATEATTELATPSAEVVPSVEVVEPDEERLQREFETNQEMAAEVMYSVAVDLLEWHIQLLERDETP